VSFPQATTGLVPISYRRALLSTLLHVSLIATSYNRPCAYLLQRSATKHSSTCKAHSHKLQQAHCLSHRSATEHSSICLIPTSHSRTSTYQLQRSATEHSSTCKSFTHKLQQPWCLPVTQERCWALFYMSLHKPVHHLLNVLVQIVNKMRLQKILYVLMPRRMSEIMFLKHCDVY
jgi:hypothetical protein